MASNILSIGQSALAAAQVGISVTGHNIANASTPGYSRQEIIQSAAQAQDFGFGYLGQGTTVASVRRIYNDILAKQLNNAQSSSAATSTYAAQMTQIDNMLADPAAGLSPAIQSFFSSIQSVASNPGDAASRQASMSSAQALVNRFQSLDGRLNEIRNSVNYELSASTQIVTSYAKQIAQLNDVISKAVGANKSNPPNDLLDQRDKIVSDLSKLVKTDVYSQDDGSYNLFIGNGLPLVIGNKSYGLTTVNSSTDTSRLEVAYVSNTIKTLGDNMLPGGTIGGLLQFRSGSLDSAQNQLGQIATVFTQSFNTQHKLGFDSAGSAGGDFFNVPTPDVFGDTANSVGATLSATFSNASAITSSDYRVKYDGTNYSIMRLNDSSVQSFASLPQTLDGLTFNGAMAAGDSFLIQPTRNAASKLSVAITNISKIAASDAAGGNGNNRNALLLAALQGSSTMNNGTMSYENAFGQLVSFVGNKTNELKVNGAAEEALLAQTTAAQQSQSGVNLDEEATNLLRYQQAYQAAGKVMQIASTMFDTLLALGR
jgi:flagellar hook-associated protein 1 FlgK